MPEQRKTSQRKRIPDWSAQAFFDFQDHMEQLTQILEMTMSGMISLMSAPKLTDILMPASQNDPEDLKRRAKEAELAKLAESEVNSGYPTLNSQATVMLWTGLEDMTRTLVQQWILNNPDIRRKDPFASIRVKLGEYESLDDHEKALFLAEALEQQLGATFRKGITRYEAVFEAIGLSGAVKEETKRAIYELQQVRNVIVHKRGIADARLCEACPWLAVEPGDPVTVTQAMFGTYSSAVNDYTLELIHRTGEHFGFSRARRKKAPRRLTQRGQPAV